MNGFINFLFVSTAPPVKPEQQQVSLPAQEPKTKKRQPVTPAADFPDSDPEDDYDKGCVISHNLYNCYLFFLMFRKS